MIRSGKRHTVVPREYFGLLSKTLPFSDLDTGTIERLAVGCVIEYFPKGTVILRQDVSDVSHCHVIHKGGVKFYVSSDDTLVTLRDLGGEGESFGAMSMVKNEKSECNVEAIEDTFCLLIDKETFLEIFRKNDRFAKFYLDSFSEDVMGAMYSELRCDRMELRGVRTYHLFDTQLSEVLKGPPVFIDATATVRHAAERMTQLGADALLVQGQSGSIAGIIVDSDMRTKVVAEGLDYETPVEQIMSSPVLTIPAQASCFDALLKLMRDRVGHLVVEHRKSVIGVLSSQDIVIYQGASPVLLFREIESQRSAEGLCAQTRKMPIVMRTLLEEGARSGHITTILTIFNDTVFKKLLSYVQDELGPAPMPFCWLMLNSEGRKERIFPGDRSNALVYAATPKEQEGTDYYKTFSARAAAFMISCGYAPAENEGARSNAPFCQPYSWWRNYFDDLIRRPDPQKVMASKNFLDLRPLFGETTLGDSLRKYMCELAMNHPIFLRLLANDCLSQWPRVSFFRDHVVENDGAHSARLDLKMRGLTPFINFARLMSLRHGIRETSTVDRLRLLSEQGCVPQELCTEIREAFEFHVQLTLVNQLRMVENGMQPDSYIRPSELTDRERRTLKEAFSVMDRMMNHIKKEFNGST